MLLRVYYSHELYTYEDNQFSTLDLHQNFPRSKAGELLIRVEITILSLQPKNRVVHSSLHSTISNQLGLRHRVAISILNPRIIYCNIYV